MQDILVKNIIFDLGGVFLHLDYNQTKLEFEKLGVQNFDELYSQKKQTPLFDDFETGKINEDDFLNEIKKDIPQANLPQINNAWNAMLGQLKIDEFTLLKKICKNYNICLLSNTNTIHLKWIEKHVSNYKEFELHFLKTYYSHQIGMRKPHAEVFDFVIADMDWNKENTLFIDDTIQHIEGATQFGIQSIHLQVNSGDSILNYFDKNGKLK